MTIYPIEFATPAYDETVRLRDKILRQPLGLEFTAPELAKEYEYVHLAAYDEQGRLAACLVLVPQNEEEIKMQQVAVVEGLQKKGVGSQLVAASERWAQRNAYQRMVLNARDVAIPFYKKLAYKKVGKPFTEVNIKHYRMEKELSEATDD